MIPIGNINFDELEIPGNTPDMLGFGASIPGGPGAEQMPKGILQGIAAKQPALGQLGPDPSVIFDETFGGQKIPYNATVASDPYKNYNVADTYKQSDFYDNSMNSQGYLDFLQDARDNFMRRDMQMDGKSAAYNDARSKIFDAYDTFNPVTNIAEQKAYYAANPYTLGGPGNVRKYDDGFFLEPIPRGGFVPRGGSEMDPGTGMNLSPTGQILDEFGNPVTGTATAAAGMGQEDNRSLEEKMIERYGSMDNVPLTNFGFEPAPTNTMQPILTPGVDYDAQANDAGGMNTFADNTDFFNNMHSSPFTNASIFANEPTGPVTPQQPTGGMNSDFANQLLSGIGNLFDKYLSSPSMKQNNLGMGSTNQITPPTPPEQMMTADTQSSMPNSLGSQGMFTPGRGY
jgi:hypothetical protein